MRSSAGNRLPTVFVPHGGGPCFFMDWTMGPADTWDKMAGFLRSFDTVGGSRPDAILAISGHHEGDMVEIMSSPHPPMLFDYCGFPPHTYELTYPAPGSPELADQLAGLLSDSGITHRFDPKRGFDHGVFGGHREQLFEHDASFELPQMLAQAFVGAVPEGEVAPGTA